MKCINESMTIRPKQSFRLSPSKYTINCHIFGPNLNQCESAIGQIPSIFIYI